MIQIHCSNHHASPSKQPTIAVSLGEEDQHLVALTIETHPDGTCYLRRWGIELPRGLAGIYLHRIDSEDPGHDLHDHPWPFATIILRGQYIEQLAESRRAFLWRGRFRPVHRRRRRWSIHRMPLTMAHRIIAAEPGTWTLVLRGRRSRSWGFYTDHGWVDWRNHHSADRPLREVRR